ncbi:Chromobox protein 5 [Blattella germanica]|nr:Chromobox protein 5 [Blattella germanica]
MKPLKRRRGNRNKLKNGKKRYVEEDKPRGFDQGLETEKIIGATHSNGEFLFNTTTDILVLSYVT